MIKLDTPREAVTKAARTVADTTVSATSKAKEVGSTTVKTVADAPITTRAKEVGSAAASTAADTAKTLFNKTQAVTGKGVEKVSDLPLGDKNIGERAHDTVETVQEKIDVEQIQEQVAKLREQMESVLGSWKESFRPGTSSDDAVKVAEEAVEKATAAKKTTAKKSATAKTTTTKKTATKATAAKKSATAKTTTTKKTTTKATAAKKPSSK